LLETEFWNPNISAVYNLGPGELCGLPETSPAIDVETGQINASGAEAHDYAVASKGFLFPGDLIARGGPSEYPLALYRIKPPLRVGWTTEGVTPDGWMGASSSYSVFGSAEGDRPVKVEVGIGRTGWSGPDVPGHVRIVVGKPAASGKLAKVYHVRRWVVHSLAQRAFMFDVRPPVRIEVHVRPTFSPSQFGLPDTRWLGAQVSFGYARVEPRRGATSGSARTAG
jgi:hypothetical protein